MSASRNEMTGDVIANVKGDHRLFSEGHERIFGKRERRQYIPPCIPSSDDVSSPQSTGSIHHDDNAGAV